MCSTELGWPLFGLVVGSLVLRRRSFRSDEHALTDATRPAEYSLIRSEAPNTDRCDKNTAVFWPACMVNERYV